MVFYNKRFHKLIAVKEKDETLFGCRVRSISKLIHSGYKLALVMSCLLGETSCGAGAPIKGTRATQPDDATGKMASKATTVATVW